MSSVDAPPELPEPSARGIFAKTPLAHLLVYAQDRDLTGTFEFAAPTGQTATVLFIEGQPTKARTSETTVYLIRVLFELGMLSEDQLDAILPRLLLGTELHGQVLLREGLITEEQLELALRAQLVHQMQALVRLPPATTFAFYDCFDGLANYGGDGHVGIDPFPVVWACIRDEPPWDHIQLGLKRVGALGVKLTEAAETSRFAFDKPERATVELLRQTPMRIGELTAAGVMAPREVQLLVYCLLVTKQVELVRESKLPEAPPSDAEIADAPPSSPFATNVLEAATGPQKVARVQLAQRTVTRGVVEEDSSAAHLSEEGEDGRRTYVATQPRTFRKRSAAKADPASEPGPPTADTDSSEAGEPAPETPGSATLVAREHDPADPSGAPQPPRDAPPAALAAPALTPDDSTETDDAWPDAPPEVSPTDAPATSAVVDAGLLPTHVPPVGGARTVPPPPEAPETADAVPPPSAPTRVPGLPRPPPIAGARRLPPLRAAIPPRAVASSPTPIGPAPATAANTAITAPPPPLDAAYADIFHIPTPAKGVAAVDAAPPAPPPVAVQNVGEVHELPTVPKMAVVTPEQIAEFAAAAEAKAAGTTPNGQPPARVKSKPPPHVKPRCPPQVQTGPPVDAEPLGPSDATAPNSSRRTAQQSLTVATPAVGEPSPPDAKPPPGGLPPSDSDDAGSDSISLRGESINDAPPHSRAPGPPSPRAAEMTAELDARKKEILAKAAVIDKEDYYAVLGVARDSPAAEIQKAFFGLAKKWHPDRVPPALADVKELCAKVFGRMSEAHQTLMDPAKRSKYDSSKKPGADDSPEAQAQVAAILGAATDFQKAEICLKRNDLKQAEDFCKKAIDVDPKQADYIAMMTWLQAQKLGKQDNASMQQQVAELTRALTISQACERAYFYRAVLQKKLGQEALAMKDFRRALELNPRNVDAQRELRLYNMRGGSKASKPPEGGGGIFGRLFKK